MGCFSKLGRDFPPSDDLVHELNKFTCLLCDDKASTTADECRYALFKSGKCSDDVLPPTCDSLIQHIYRANFQAASWYQCLSPEVDLPSPVGNGWTLDNNELEITWMTRPPAECVECKCKTGCSTMRCSCKKTDLKCTDLCSFCDCQNTVAGNDDSDDDDGYYGLALLADDDELGGSDLDFGDDDLWS